jgi:hypothetical protein
MTYLNRDATANFLCQRLHGHTHFLTVTMRPASLALNTLDRRSQLEETVRHFLYRLSRACFKRRHRRRGLTVGSYASIETGCSGNHLHAHITLACPPNFGYETFEGLILSSVKRCRTLGPEMDLRPIHSTTGLAQYLSKEGQEALLPKAIQDAKY